MQEYRTLNFFPKGIDSLPWVRSAFGNVLNLHRPLLLTRRIYVAISFYYRYRIEIQIGKHLALKKVNDPIERMRLDDYWKFCFRHNFSAWRNNRWLLVNYFTITSREKGDLDLQIYLYITIDLLVSSPDLSESFNLNITTFRVAFQCTKQEERATLFKASWSAHRKSFHLIVLFLRLLPSCLFSLTHSVTCSEIPSSGRDTLFSVGHLS